MASGVPKRPGWGAMDAHLKRRLVLLLLFPCIGAFYALTLPEGFSWFGDAPAYVQHSLNIVEGRPYADTGYLQNPHHFLAPQAYPPGYPAIMAPVIAAFGVDVSLLRLQGILLFLAALAVLVLAFRSELPFALECVFVLAVGLHPFFWELLQRLSPDVAFALFSYASLAAYMHALEQRTTQRRLLWGLVAGVGLASAVLTRSIGIVLVPCFLAYDLIRFRRPSRPLLAALGLCLSLYVGQLLLAGPSASSRSGYEQLVQENLINRLASAVYGLPTILMRYVRVVDALWSNGYSRLLQHTLFLTSAPFVIAGFGRRLWHRFSVFEVFSLLYLAALLPWTFVHARYLVPLIPLYYFYLFKGIAWLHEASRLSLRAVAAACALIALGTGAARYTALPAEPARPVVYTTPDAEALYERVRHYTEAGDVIASEFPRQIAFFTNRSVTIPPYDDRGNQVLAYLRKVGAKYVIVGPPEEMKPWPTLYYELADYVHRHPKHFEQVYANPTFQLYRIEPQAPPPQASSPQAPE